MHHVRSQRQLVPLSLITCSFLVAAGGDVETPQAMQLASGPAWVTPAGCLTLALRGGADGSGRREGGHTGGEPPQLTLR